MSLHSKNTNIGVRHFRAALALAREQSFVRAAEALGVVPSALTETIKQIEADCGLRLFDREARPVTPTAAGVEFHESTWSGWLTTPDASRLAMPASVSVAGSHAEPSPYTYEFIDDDPDDDTDEDTNGSWAGQVA